LSSASNVAGEKMVECRRSPAFYLVVATFLRMPEMDEVRILFEK
jgi:hypothetical protein